MVGPIAVLLLCLGHVAAAELVLMDVGSGVRIRPGSSRTISYVLLGGPGAHNIAFSGAGQIPGVSVAAHTGINEGTIVVTINASAGAGIEVIQVTARAGGSAISPPQALPLSIDPPPHLNPAVPNLTVDEDASAMHLVGFEDDTPSDDTWTQSTDASLLHADGVRLSDRSLQFTLTPVANVYGSTMLRLTLTDLVGPTVFDIPVSIRATNDPPVVTLTPLPDPVMDPVVGTPVALVSRLDIAPGVDAQVTTAAHGAYLGLSAEVSDGVDGVDVLSLRGDADYRVDDGTISAMADGAPIATWTRSSGDSRRLDLALDSSGSATQLGELARLLRYSHVQQPAVQLTRTIRITVVEPDADGGSDPADAVTCTCRVAPVDRPPEVTLHPIEVEPLHSAAIDLGIVDGSGLAGLTVRVVDPLPSGGHVEPSTCDGAAAASGAMRYVHTAGDISDDHVSLAISDGRNPAVVVATTVAIRSRPDRVSIISDPLIEAVRGQATVWPIQTVPAGSELHLVAYGPGFPGLQDGVALTDAGLAIDWTRIPASTGWLALAIEATSRMPLPHGQSAMQRMLIRIRSAVPGISN